MDEQIPKKIARKTKKINTLGVILENKKHHSKYLHCNKKKDTSKKRQYNNGRTPTQIVIKRRQRDAINNKTLNMHDDNSDGQY